MLRMTCISFMLLTLTINLCQAVEKNQRSKDKAKTPTASEIYPWPSNRPKIQ